MTLVQDTMIAVEKQMLVRVIKTLREFELSGDCSVQRNPYCIIPLPAVTNEGGWHWHCPECGATALDSGAVEPHHASCGLGNATRSLSRLLEP